MNLKIGDLIYYPGQKSIGIVVAFKKNDYQYEGTKCLNVWLTGWEGNNGRVEDGGYWDSEEFTKVCRKEFLDKLRKTK